jgi:hypothetical protein
MAVQFKSTSSSSGSGGRKAPKASIFSGAGMKPVHGRWKKRLFITIGAMLGILIGGIVYTYVQITAALPRSEFHGTINTSSKKAADKYELFREAFLTKEKGFAPFTEIEINSYVKSKLLPQKSPKPIQSKSEPIYVPQPELVRNVSLKLEPPTKMEWILHIDAIWFGMSHELYLRKQIEMLASVNDVEYRTVGMKVGQLNVPEKYWDLLEPAWTEILSPYAAELQEIMRVPFARLVYNKKMKENELQLYTVSRKEGFGKSEQ